MSIYRFSILGWTMYFIYFIVDILLIIYFIRFIIYNDFGALFIPGSFMLLAAFYLFTRVILSPYGIYLIEDNTLVARGLFFKRIIPISTCIKMKVTPEIKGVRHPSFAMLIYSGGQLAIMPEETGFTRLIEIIESNNASFIVQEATFI